MKKHDGYIRHVEAAKTCVVFCHGILGSPRHFDELALLVPHEFSICNILLEGHGGSVIDFGKSNMRIWESQVSTIVESLSEKYENIIYVCHSMGSLFGLENAIKTSSIKSLFVLASPLYPHAAFKSVVISARIIFQKEENLGEIAAAKNQVCSVKLTKKLWQYISWIPRFCQLLAKSKQTRKIIQKVKCNGVFLQSAHDEVVMRKSSKLISQNKNFKLITLENSSHYLYSCEDKQIIISEFKKLMQRHSKQNKK